MRSGAVPFKLKNMWLKEVGFKGWWMDYNFRSSPKLVLSVKLKALKLDLKKETEKCLAMFPSRRRSLKIRWVLDSKDGEGSLSKEKDEVRRLAKEHFRKWALFEEALWREKSREVGQRRVIETLNFPQNDQCS